MIATLWQKCLDSLEEELPPDQFNSFIKPLQYEVSGHVLHLLAPNRYVLASVNSQKDRIENLAKEFGCKKVVLRVGSKVDVGNRPRTKPRTTARFLTPNRLNEDFTFDSFVEGESNRLAKASAIEVTKNPGQRFSPLLIHGGVGLGKTHLMQAIGNAILKENDGVCIAYMASQRFMDHMVRSIQNGAMSDFSQYYQSIDVLLIDDIQFIARGKKTQEEFFHVFNFLEETGKQIVLTCDRYPRDISELQDSLKSRFVMGMTVQIDPPDVTTRVSILKSKADQMGLELQHEVALFIAEVCRSNVRELEGALKRVVATSSLIGQKISVAQIKNTLKDLVLANAKQTVNIGQIQEVVANHYQFTKKDLNSKRRYQLLVHARQVAMSLSRELTQHSLAEIGAQFGGRNHATVSHAIKTIQRLRQTDGRVRTDYENLLKLIQR